MKSCAREILHCDNHLLVVVKPAGLSVQPDFHEEMRRYIEIEFKKPGRAFLEPIHRLDKSVSGIVLFARTSKALERLNASMRNREIRKTYLARVEGRVEQMEATLEHTLSHGSFRAEIDPAGKPAILSYKVIERSKESSLLEIELKTGRYHQIRAQFSAIGHPILGDQKYGARESREAIALQHHQMAFRHPVTQEALMFVCTAPRELATK